MHPSRRVPRCCQVVADRRTVDRRKHQRGVVHGAADRADLVERPAQRHRARPRDAPEGGAQPGGAAARRRGDDRAQRLGADREADQPGSGGGGGPRARAARAFLGIPGIAGLAAIPDVAIGERADTGLAQQHRTGCRQAADDLGIRLRNAIGERLGTPAGGDAGGIQDVLGAVWDAVQRTEPGTRSEQVVRPPRLRERQRVRHRREAAQRRITPPDAVKIDLREPHRTELAAGDPCGQVTDRGEGDILVGHGQRGSGARDVRRRLRRHGEAGQPRVE